MAESPGCPAYRPALRWIVPLIGDPSTGDRIVVEGSGRGHQFVPTLARMVANTPPLLAGMPSLPIRAPLIPWLTASLFGEEERAVLSRKGDILELECRAGRKASGLVLSGGTRLPDGARLQLRWRADAGSGFEIGLSSGRSAPGRMVAIEADEGGFTLEHSESLQGEVRITLACPAYGGRALIRDLRLEPASEGTGPHLRAAWAWRTGLWRDKPEALVAAAQALAVGQLFISVDVFDGKLVDPDRLAAFVTNAHAQGLSVFVVEGDAGMALPAGRDSALSRLAALSAYQDRAAVASRLDGLQYDIEPYLLPDYLVDPGNVMVGWAETIAALASATALPLEMVLPFWLPSDDHARGYVLPMLAAKRTPITIMAYRTGLNAIQNAAEPLLAWSSANGVKARVALESGPLPDETTQTYIQAADGLLEITVGTDGRPRAALRTGLDGASKVRRFRFGHERVAPASNVSFLGDRERLLAMAAALEPLLVAWPSFAGLALHGMIP